MRVERAEDIQLHQRDDDERVNQRHADIADQIAPRVTLVLIADELLRAFVDEHETRYVGHPVSDDGRGQEGRPVDPRRDPASGQRDGNVHEPVIPPRKRRQHEADEAEQTALEFPTHDAQGLPRRAAGKDVIQTKTAS